MKRHKRLFNKYNANKEEIEAQVLKHDLQAVQLHGQESVAFCHELKNTLANTTEIIKAFSVDDTFDFNQLEPFETVCDYFLFDTKGELPGGNGYAFDWNILNAYPSQKPFFLSGGISKEHTTQIKSILNTDLPLYAIDVNSKFEIAPAIKNIEQLKQFKNELYEL